MKTKTWISLTIVILGVLLAVTWTHARRAREWDSARAKIDAQRTRAEAELHRAEERIARAEREQTAQHAALDELAAAKTKAASAARAMASSPRASTIADRLRTDPETQALWLVTRRTELATRYGPLMRQLKLSPEERVQFEATAIRHEERELDLRAVEGTKGISPSEPAMLTLKKQVQTEYEDSLRDLLGEDGRRQMKEYERTTTIREMVNGIAGGAVVVAGAPLSSEQGEQLIQIMANASESYGRGGQAHGGDMNWDLIDAQARALLSDAQFALFKTMEPPLPLGARHQAQLYRLVEAAKKADKAGAGKSGGG